MKENNNNIPLNPIYSDSTENSNESEHLITTNTNNNINPNILSINSKNYSSNKESVQNSTNEIQINSVELAKQKMEKIEDKTFLCSKRRKFPVKTKDLRGFFTSLGLFLFFSILFHISISQAKYISQMTDTIRNNYNNIIIAMYIFLILSILCLIEAGTSSPGRQRGTPITHEKFLKSKIKKIIGGKKYELKYCYTCNLIRDLRTFHCSRCDLCVEKHDHHCGYISNCVGAYNYKRFFIFIIIGYIHISIVFATSLHFCFYFGGHLDSGDVYLLFLFILILLVSGFFELFIFGMIMQHIQIIVINRTTREFLKKIEFKEYNRGCKRNCHEALCQDNIKEI